MAFRLEQLIPALNFRIDDGDLAAFINEVLQPVFQLACEDALRWIQEQDVDTMSSNTVDALLRDLGNPFDVAFEQPLNRRKLLARTLIDVYRAKGTVPGLVDVIRALTGLEVTVVAPATVAAFVLDEDELADTPTVPGPVPDELLTSFGFLGVSPGFNIYSFQIEVPRVLTDDERSIITEIVLLVKPAHTHFVGFIEPTVGLVLEHWELGISFLHETGQPLLGDEADLHDTP